jgi:predicted Rossmann-fold nucleotide-binding protein
VAQVREAMGLLWSKQIARANLKQKIQVVYGGSNVGLMRAVADGALGAGGM